MAHEIKELDKVMLGSNTPAWHGIGTVVAGQPNADEAFKIAGLDWEVECLPVCLPDGDGGYVEVPNSFATVRMDLDATDPRRVLGSGLSERYTPIQNRELAGFAEAICGEGDLKYETAGSLRNGRDVWMMAVSPDKTDINGDQLARYLLLHTAHDGSKAVQALYTPTRVVCANTLHFALSGAQRTASIRHTASKDEQLQNAKAVLEGAAEYFDAHEGIMQKMSDTAIDARFADAFLKALLPDPTAEDGRKWSTAAKKRDRITQLFNGDQGDGDAPAVKGTAYGLINALGEFVDHERTVLAMGGRTQADARMQSVMFGSGQEFKQMAFETLCRKFDFGDDVPSGNKAHGEKVAGVLAAIDAN